MFGAMPLKTLNALCRQLASGEFEFSHHAFRRAVERNISDDEIRQAGMNARIIEDYPDDKYTASCLLLGFTRSGRPLHLHVSRGESDQVKIITLYQPDPTEWDVSFELRS